MKFRQLNFYNPGVLEATMSEEVFQDLVSFSDKQLESKNIGYAMKRAQFTDSTVAGVEESVFVKLPKLYSDFLMNFSQEFANHFKLNVVNKTPTIIHSWLNFQKRYEYRPSHSHMDNRDMGLSFITYIRIPYDTKEEDNHPNHHKAVKFRNGRLEFLYNGFDGQQRTQIVDVNKSYEGKTLLFPNTLIHTVYPFYTSTEYRISLAGNISFM